MRSAVPISQTKLAANWQDMVRKSAARSKQAVSNDEGDQLRGQPFPCLHQSFSKSDCHNLVGKCWPHKSWEHGNIWSSQRVEPTKLSQHAVGASTPNQLVVRPPLQQLQVPSINTSISANQQSTSEFKQLFDLCTIGNVNVYNYKP